MKTPPDFRCALLTALLIWASLILASADPGNVLTDPIGISGFDLYGTSGLWWRNNGQCTSEIERHDSAIRVRAGSIYFGTKNIARDCAILPTEYDNVVRDDAYVYYFGNRQLYRKALSAPESASGKVFATPPHSPTLPSGQEGACLELANGRLWFGRYRTDIDRLDIFSIKTDGSESLQSVVSISSAGAPIRKMKWFTYSTTNGRQEALAILLANGKLYRHRFVGGNELLWVRVTDFSIHQRLILPTPRTYLYASEGTIPGIGHLSTSTQAGHLYMIDADSGLVEAIYTAPNRNQILSVLTYGNSGVGSTPTRIFLTEAAVTCGETFCDFDNVSITASPLTPFGNWGTIVLSGAGGNLRNDRDYLYYAGADFIARISLDAPPVQFDIEALGLEAGHTIQNINAAVPVAAWKDKLYVRGYAFVPTNTTGDSVFFVSARLRVWVNGQEIAGSPFSPVNSIWIDSANEVALLRPDPKRSFLFVLPGQPPGELTMAMTVNPDHTLAETNYANNLAALKHPIPILDSIGVCLQMIPMPTGMGTYNPYTPGFWEVITRARSMLPSKHLTVELQPWVFGDEVFFTEPFDFGEEGETQDADALAKIECIREQTSSSGGSDFCKFRHWVGMIHPGVTNFGGLGNVSGNALITSMSGAGNGFFTFDSPFGGVALAHEMGHNYGRLHVDCGGPDGIDGNYPFDPCTLGPGSSTGFWGFDLLSRTTVDPSITGDLMSYAPNTWISSYTWEAILAHHFSLASSMAAASLLSTHHSIHANGNQLVLFVNGYVVPKTGTAVFRTFFQLPRDGVDAGNLAQDFAESNGGRDDPLSYFIRLLDDNGRELSRTAVPVRTLSAGSGRRLPFAHWIPFDPNTRRIQLVQGPGNIVLVERIASPNAPVLQLDPPVVDLVQQKVRLSWNASDADGEALLFNVHYSADNGGTWQLIASNYRGFALTLDTRSLAGTDQARLRVTASDGVNSTPGITDRFALPKNPPQPFISGVAEGQRLNFGQHTELSGAALDPEQDSESVRLNWNLTGPTPHAGTNALLTLDGLSPGAYTATLTATDADNLLGEATRHFEVLPLIIPEGPAPKLDGFCRDDAYRNAASVQIPFGDGSFASACLVHSGSDLFVSFTDLSPIGFAEAIRRVGLRVDADASGDSTPLPGDRGFFMDATGIPAQEVGDGEHMVVTDSPLPGFKAALGVGGTAWSAEFRIADSLLGGWNHPVRIMFDHDAPHWPAAANDSQPATWALAYPGTALPSLPNRPPVAQAGSDQQINFSSIQTIVLDGSASYDPDGDPLTFQWTQTEGPNVALSNATQAAARFTIPTVANTTSLRFRLVVNDGKLDGSAEVQITLLPALRSDEPSPSAPPVRHEWRGTVSGNWSEPRNWSPATVPAPADPILFLANATRKTMTNDLPPRAFGNMTFSGDNLDLYGNAIILGSPSGGNTISGLGGAVSNALHLDIVLAGPVTISATGNFGIKTLSLLGDISLGSHSLTFVTDGDAVCSGAISGTGGITKSDRGRLMFSGSSANTYSGPTVVTEGTFELGKSGGLAVPRDLHIGGNPNSATAATVVYTAANQIADNANVTVFRTGQLNLNNYDDAIGTLEVSGGDVATGNGVLTLNGDIACTRQDVNGSTISGRLKLAGPTTSVDVRADALLVMSAVLSSGPSNTRFKKLGPGELQLRAANTYTALTRVTEGTLRVTASGGLGSGPSDVVLEGGKLVLASASISDKKLVASQPGVLATEGQLSSWSGPMTLTGRVEVNAAATSTLVCSGRIDGPGGFRETGPGLWRLEGTEANTFQGGVTILQGTLELAKSLGDQAPVAIPGPFTVGDPADTHIAKAIVRYINPDQIADDASVAIERSGLMIMRDRSDVIGSLSGGGEVQLGTATLTVGGELRPPSGQPVFTGVISGAGNLVKAGPGTLILGGENTYTGETIVEEGTLLVNGQLTASSLQKVQAGATLGGNGRVQKVNVLGGRVSPGASPGSFSVNELQLTTGALDIELNENTVGTGYDQLIARGAVILGGALNVSLGFVPAIGDTFVVLNKTSSGPITGIFNALAEGATLAVNGETFRISYVGGNGNDVVLTHSGSSPPISSSFYFGLQHTPLGRAKLNSGPLGNLIVGNLHSTGEDGVRIPLGDAQGWRGQLTALDPSAGQGRLSWEIQRQDGNAAAQVIGRGSVEVIKGEIHAFADSSAVGATAHWVEVFAGDEFLKSAVVPSNAALYRLLAPLTKAHAMTLRYEGPLPGKPYWTCEISWPEPHRIAMPTDDTPLDGATRVRVIPWLPKESAKTGSSALQLTGKNISEFQISDEALFIAPLPADEGLPQRALGQTRFEARDGQLILSNIGSSGEDGVSIEVGDRGSGIGLLTAPISLQPDGTEVHLGAVGTFDGKPGSSMGAAGLKKVGPALQVIADFTLVGSARVRLEVSKGSEVVGSATEAGGVVATMAAPVGGILPSLKMAGLVPAVMPGVDGPVQTDFYPLPCYSLHFDGPALFTTQSGQQIIGDSLRVFTANNQPRLQALARFEIRAALKNGSSSLTLELEKLRMATPEITRVFPPQTRSGEIVEILGRGFGNDPRDLNVVGSARVAGLVQLTVPFRVLSASDTRILARVGHVPPGTPSGPLQVRRGVGNEGIPQGASSDVEFTEPVHAWREAAPSGSRGDDSVEPSIQLTYQPEPAKILAPEHCFESGPPSGGVLRVHIDYWPVNAVVRFCSHVTAAVGQGGVSVDASDVRFLGGDSVIHGAQRFAELLETTFAQQAGLIVKAEAFLNPDGATVILSLPTALIGDGFLNLCVRPSEIVLSVANFFPQVAAEGNLVTINGQGFGDDTRDLRVGIRDAKGARLFPMQVLRVTDSQILARMGPAPADFTQGPIEVRRGEGQRVPSKTQASVDLHEIWQDGNTIALSTSNLGHEIELLSSCYYSENNTYQDPTTGYLIYPPPGDDYRPPVLALSTSWPSSAQLTINALVYRPVAWLFGGAWIPIRYQVIIDAPTCGSPHECASYIIDALQDVLRQDGFCLGVASEQVPPFGWIKMTPHLTDTLDCELGLMGEFSVCVGPPQPPIKVVQATTDGGISRISGGGFGDQAEDLNVAMLDGGGTRLMPLEVLAASDTEITARMGTAPPDAQPGPIMVTRGNGSLNSPQPFFDDVNLGSDAKTWRGRATSIVSTEKVTPEPTKPETGRRLFFSGLPSNGELSVVMDGDWSSEATASISAVVQDTKNNLASEFSARTVRFTTTSKLLDRAERIADVIRSAFWQNAALAVDVKVTSLPGGAVNLSLSLLDGVIDRGSLAIRLAEPPVITAVPTGRGGPGDVVTISGHGFGTNSDDLLVYVQGNNGVPTPLQVLSATDTQIVATVGFVRPDAQPGQIVVTRGDGARFQRVVPGITDAHVQTWFPAGEVFTRSKEAFDPIVPTPTFNTAVFYGMDTNGVISVEVEGDWPKNVQVFIQLVLFPDIINIALDLPGGAAQLCAEAIRAALDGLITPSLHFTLHCAVTQTGPKRFKFTISADGPLDGFIGIYYNKPIPFAGLGAYAVGPRAQIERLDSRNFRVSNIGSSGLDGMRWDLGESQGLLWDLRTPGTSLDGARLVLEPTGKVGGQSALFDRTILEWIGSDLRITPDPSLSGATHYQRRILLKGKVVHQQSGLMGVAALVHNSTPLIESAYRLNPLSSSFEFSDALTMDLGGGLTVLADTIEVIYEDIPVQPEFMSNLTILGADLPQFSLERGRVLMFPKPDLPAQPYLALGEAQFDVRKDRLVISNIGSSGEAGVSIGFDELTQKGLPAVRNYNARLEPLSLPTGGEFKVSATGPLGGTDRALLGEATVRKPNGSLEVFADFSPVNSSQLTVEVYKQGKQVGTKSFAGGGRVATLPDFKVSATGLLRGSNRALLSAESAPSSPFGFLLGFDEAGTFDLGDGSKFIGDEIHLLAADVSRVPENLSSLDLVGTGYDTFTIRSETPSVTRMSVRLVSDGIEISWTGVGTLEEAPDPAGPWQAVTPVPASSPHMEAPNEQTKFFRLRL